jgi:RNA polymerase sigma-70 factor (ECF subfamily)
VGDHEHISREALHGLVERHADFLSFLERRVGSRDLAEDLLQDAFARGIQRGGAIRDGESAVAWFYRLLRNAVIDHARRRAAGERSLRRWADELATTTDMDASLHRAACKCITPLVDTLKPEYAAALRAVDVAGKPLNLFAKEAGITRNNAAVRLHRARLALGKQLRTSCGACATHGCLDCSCV